MLGDLADLLEVDMSLENVKHLGFARLRIQLPLGKDLPDTKFFSFSRQVYPIMFCRSWDLCPSSSSSWNDAPFSLGSSSNRVAQKPPGRPFKSQKNWKGAALTGR